MAQESLTESLEVEFWFDFASTYSYPASMRVEDVADRYRCGVRWRPFLLGPIFKAQGWTDSPFNIYPVKGRYMWRDLERLCAADKIPFRKPSAFRAAACSPPGCHAPSKRLPCPSLRGGFSRPTS